MAFIARIGEKQSRVNVKEAGTSIYDVSVDGREYKVDAHKMEPTIYSLLVNGLSFEVDVGVNGSVYSVFVQGESYEIDLADEKRRRVTLGDLQGSAVGRQVIAAPMPGKVVKILVKQGDKVKRGQGVIVVEAMKMENELKSPKDGTVGQIHVMEGQTVEASTRLLIVE